MIPICTRSMVLPVVLVATLFSVAACREEEDETLPASSATPSAQVGATPAGTGGTDWLDIDEDEAPADFVARVTGVDAAEVAPRIALLAQQYREGPRMIANRTVQLWSEVHPNDPDMTLGRLLDDLAAPGRGAQNVSLGPVIQQYLIQRRNGVDHASAIRAATKGE